METLRTTLLILHISSAAVLVGAGTGMTRSLKRTLELSRDAFLISAEDCRKRGALMSTCSLLTLASGLGLIFLMGGFGAAPLNFHIALTLMLLAVSVSVAVMKPAAAQLLKLAQGQIVDKAKALSAIKKLTIGQGILHLLWLSMLTLMLVRIYR